MPTPFQLNDHEMSLAWPIDQQRRPQFLQEIALELEAKRRPAKSARGWCIGWRAGYEGVGSKTVDAPYAPGNRGLWRKSKCLNRQEFVVFGWTDPEGSRPHLGALLLGYYGDESKLVYAGRVGTGMSQKVLKNLRRRLDPLARPKSLLSVPPPRSTRFGSPLVLSASTGSSQNLLPKLPI
jgi:hypothetical protein